MAWTSKALMIPALLASCTGFAADRSASDKSASSGHYTEHTCMFGKYGAVTVHEGGIKDTYILKHGKKYPSSGGENFVQSDDDDSVVVMFDRKGNLSYQGQIPGRNCRVVRR